MLGTGKYVFKDGSQQIGEYVLEMNDECNNNSEKETISDENNLVTKWKCKRRIRATLQKSMVAEEV